MLKLRTRIMLLVCTVVAAVLLLNHYPVSLSLRQTVTQASISALSDLTRQLAESGELLRAMQEVTGEEQTSEKQEDARRRLAVLAHRTERCSNHNLLYRTVWAGGKCDSGDCEAPELKRMEMEEFTSPPR